MNDQKELAAMITPEIKEQAIKTLVEIASKPLSKTQRSALNALKRWEKRTGQPVVPKGMGGLLDKAQATLEQQKADTEERRITVQWADGTPIGAESGKPLTPEEA